VIKGDNTFLVHPGGVAIDPKDGEVFATDSIRNGLFSFLAPNLFPQRSPSRSNLGNATTRSAR
jgi:hypothetical protein